MDNTDITIQNQTGLESKKLDPISFFEKDLDFVFVYKKTEKLASAVYMITNLFGDNEPMKWTLRKKVSDLLSFIVNYKDIRQSNLSDFVYNVQGKILELVSLLEVSYRGGLVSDMNFSILKQEFSNLTELLNNKTTKTEVSKENISKAFFETINTVNPVNHDNTYGENILKDTSLLKETEVFKRNNRQNIILGMLKKKKELTIKDIALVIKDVSEKTIQRELVSLIAAGVLDKTGERRWSKYTLKNS